MAAAYRQGAIAARANGKVSRIRPIAAGDCYDAITSSDASLYIFTYEPNHTIDIRNSASAHRQRAIAVIANGKVSRIRPIAAGDCYDAITSSDVIIYISTQGPNHTIDIRNIASAHRQTAIACVADKKVARSGPCSPRGNRCRAVAASAVAQGAICIRYRATTDREAAGAAVAYGKAVGVCPCAARDRYTTKAVGLITYIAD